MLTLSELPLSQLLMTPTRQHLSLTGVDIKSFFSLRKTGSPTLARIGPYGRLCRKKERDARFGYGPRSRTVKFQTVLSRKLLTGVSLPLFLKAGSILLADRLQMLMVEKSGSRFATAKSLMLTNRSKIDEAKDNKVGQIRFLHRIISPTKALNALSWMTLLPGKLPCSSHPNTA